MGRADVCGGRRHPARPPAAVEYSRLSMAGLCSKGHDEVPGAPARKEDVMDKAAGKGLVCRPACGRGRRVWGGGSSHHSFGPWAAAVYVAQHPTEMHVVDLTDTMGTSMTSLASEASSIAAGPGIGVFSARPRPALYAARSEVPTPVPRVLQGAPASRCPAHRSRGRFRSGRPRKAWARCVCVCVCVCLLAQQPIR
jgi:hypothetical protein